MSNTIPLDILLNSPEKLEIEGLTYSLKTYLWRNLMPGTDPSERGVQAIAKLIALEQTTFPNTLKMDSIWLIKDKEVWQGNFLDETRIAEEPNQLEMLAIGAPVWDGEVIVVVQLDSNGQRHFLKAEKQKISKTF
jgi:hypothetical protein